MIESVEKKFRELFGGNPLLIRSPGRVNFIGEHTDYNLGFVLPGAIDKAIYFAVAPRNDNKCFLHSVDFNDTFEFDVSSPSYSEKHWPNYLQGVVDQLNKLNYPLKGFNCVFGGDIPIGAGLSSSAAIEAGLIFGLNHLFELGIDRLGLVKLAQKAENEFVGVKCGIMDQFVNIFGKKENLLRIDCRSLEFEYLPFNYDNISILLFDTGVSHSLASSEYNNRRSECASGVEIISSEFGNVKSLRDVSSSLLDQFKNRMDEKVFKRCRYVVGENERILLASRYLNEHNLKGFGELMYKTHKGLSEDYEVSCEELDLLVELTERFPQVIGARMMGGGFGGCTINLVENDAVEEVGNFISSEYRKKFSLEAKVYKTKICPGTEIIR